MQICHSPFSIQSLPGQNQTWLEVLLSYSEKVETQMCFSTEYPL